jgi:hypothetical protein
MNLIEELTAEKASTFKLDKPDKKAIDKTLSENTKGIFDLFYKLKKKDATRILHYLKDYYPNNESGIIFTGENYQIGFRKMENIN